MKIKKYLSFASLRTMTSSHIRNWADNRRENSTEYSLHDAMMSGFACMYFQSTSLRHFEKQLKVKRFQKNLGTLLAIQNVPSTTQMRNVIDDQPSVQFKPIFKELIRRLDRGKHLSQFELMPGLTICGIDGTYYHSSPVIHCKQCLTKEHKDKDGNVVSKTYQHIALQAALMHPNQKQVLPLMVEPVYNTDGSDKQDCELNAAKRLIPMFRQDYPKKRLLITGDDLFSHQPMINLVLENNFHYCFVAKPSSHTYMMQGIKTHGSLNTLKIIEDQGRILLYEWINDVPLHGGKDAIHVNYFRRRIFVIDPTGKEAVITTQSWVTDIEVEKETVVIVGQRWPVSLESRKRVF